MKSKLELPPNNPFEEVHADLAALLLALHEATQDKLERIPESQEWKKGYDQATSTVIVAFMEAYLPSLKRRSAKWEEASNNLFKQNFEAN